MTDYCDPELHAGERVHAAFHLFLPDRPVLSRRVYACCALHVAEAWAELDPAEGEVVRLRRAYVDVADRLKPVAVTETGRVPHKAVPTQRQPGGVALCGVCLEPVRKVAGGHGHTWVHEASGLVVGFTEATVRL